MLLVCIYVQTGLFRYPATPYFLFKPSSKIALFYWVFQKFWNLLWYQNGSKTGSRDVPKTARRGRAKLIFNLKEVKYDYKQNAVLRV